MIVMMFVADVYYMIDFQSLKGFDRRLYVYCWLLVFGLYDLKRYIDLNSALVICFFSPSSITSNRFSIFDLYLLF